MKCREDVSQHLEQDCGKMEETCKLGCGMKLTRNELKTHVHTCVRRNVPCEYCSKDFKFCDITNHTDVCPKMEVSCELSCGVVMRRENMAQHLEQECGLVEEMCELGCGTKLTRDELKIHVTNTCQQRLLQCEHCEESVKFCDMTNHPDVCPKIEVSCELTCGASMFREDMAQHLGKHCPEKEVECPFAKYNCEVTSIKRQHLDAHLDKNRIEHMELKLNHFEDSMTQNMMNWQKEAKRNRITVNRLSEQINTLCSINNTTKLMWIIQDITEFVQNIQPVQQNKVDKFLLQTYFVRDSIWVSFLNKHGGARTSIVAKFMVSLYSNLKMKVIKQYKQDISQYQTGDVKREIARISTSDIEEFSSMGATGDIILEMYVTLVL